MRDQLSWSGRWCRGKGWSLPGGGGWLSPGGSQTHRPTTVPAGAGLCSADTDCSAASQRAGSPSAWESRIKNSMKGQTRAGGKGKCQNHICWPFQRWRKVWVTLSYSTLCDPWTVARQAPLSMRFSRQEYWSGLPCPPPGDLTHPGIEPASPALAGRFLTTGPPGKPNYKM